MTMLLWQHFSVFENTHGKVDISPPYVCCRSACCHTVYGVNIRPFMFQFAGLPHLLPHPVMLLLATLQNPPASPALSSPSSSSSLPLLSPLTLSSGNKMSATYEPCRGPPPPPTPSLSLSLSFLLWLTELHSSYVRAKVKVSLPLSRET